MEEWREVFWLSAVILIFTNMVYLQFGSGNVQPWNEYARRRNQATDNSIENIESSIILKPL